jgi:hypothetical protein
VSLPTDQQQRQHRWVSTAAAAARKQHTLGHASSSAGCACVRCIWQLRVQHQHACMHAQHQQQQCFQNSSSTTNGVSRRLLLLFCLIPQQAAGAAGPAAPAAHQDLEAQVCEADGGGGQRPGQDHTHQRAAVKAGRAAAGAQRQHANREVLQAAGVQCTALH